MKNWIFLCIAIVFEVFATASMSASNGFTKLTPSLLAVVGYAIAFYFLAQTLKVIPVGVAYGIWAGLGVVLVAIWLGTLWSETRCRSDGWHRVDR
jgi:small multidrug resistance pump